MRDGDAAKACDAFGRGVREYEGRQVPAGLLMNLAECSAATDKPFAAFQYEERALAALSPSDERCTLAEAKRQELEALVRMLQVKRWHRALGERPSRWTDGWLDRPTLVTLRLRSDSIELPRSRRMDAALHIP